LRLLSAHRPEGAHTRLRSSQSPWSGRTRHSCRPGEQDAQRSCSGSSGSSNRNRLSCRRIPIGCSRRSAGKFSRQAWHLSRTLPWRCSWTCTQHRSTWSLSPLLMLKISVQTHQNVKMIHTIAASPGGSAKVRATATQISVKSTRTPGRISSPAGSVGTWFILGKSW